ncbi:MAG: T9SS C-terminal target domain-containing protein [Sphingobacteriia bacterium]|nr:T9SS C-terminal target domain-containing protein [Sphingobacteriia bacterium]
MCRKFYINCYVLRRRYCRNFKSFFKCLSVFPNPSDHLNISGLNASTYEVSIFNVQGIRVKALTLKDTQSAIETHDLKAGMYWIQVKDPQTAKVKTLKWIKS